MVPTRYEEVTIPMTEATFCCGCENCGCNDAVEDCC